jgi:hypothetical protein
MEDVRIFGYKHWTLENPSRCFNVGKGVVGRAESHGSRNHKWRAVVKRLGLRVEICVGPMTNEEACAWEVKHILKENTFSTNHSHDDPVDIGCNFTKGGDGVVGRPQSKAERSFRSQVAKQYYRNNPAARLRTSVIMKRRWQDTQFREEWTQKTLARQTLRVQKRQELKLVRIEKYLREEQACCELYERGMSLRQVAKKLSLTLKVVFNRLHNAGVTMRPVGGRATEVITTLKAL